MQTPNAPLTKVASLEGKQWLPLNVPAVRGQRNSTQLRPVHARPPYETSRRQAPRLREPLRFESGLRASPRALDAAPGARRVRARFRERFPRNYSGDASLG